MGHITYLKRQVKVHTGIQSIKGAAKLGRPVTATGKTNASKVREIIESGGRYIYCGNVKTVGILLTRVHFILFSKYERFLPDGYIPIYWQDSKTGTRTDGQVIAKQFPNFRNKGNLQALLLETRHGCTISSQ